MGRFADRLEGIPSKSLQEVPVDDDAPAVGGEANQDGRASSGMHQAGSTTEKGHSNEPELRRHVSLPGAFPVSPSGNSRTARQIAPPQMRPWQSQSAAGGDAMNPSTEFGLLTKILSERGHFDQEEEEESDISPFDCEAVTATTDIIQVPQPSRDPERERSKELERAIAKGATVVEIPYGSNNSTLSVERESAGPVQAGVTYPAEDTLGYATSIVAELAPDHSALIREKEQAEREKEDLRRRLEELEQREKDMPTGEVVLEPTAAPSNTSQFARRAAAATICLLIVAVVTALAVVLAPSDGEEPAVVSPSKKPLLPVLESVKQSGVLRCRAESFEVEQGSGFSLDLCRAIAAAIFDDPSRAQFPYFPFSEQFGAINRGELDMSTTQTSLNMGRDVYEQKSKAGCTYSVPYYYSGTFFAGSQDMVDCVENLNTFGDSCRQLKVCVLSETVSEETVEALLPGSLTLLVTDSVDLFENFASGTCNVIAGARSLIFEQRVRDAGYNGEYVFSKKMYSYEPLAMVTREDDPEFSDFANWILQALITAEHLNITQATASSFPRTHLFGEEYQDMFRRAIAAVGNYGELYERHYQARVPRSGANLLNTGETGLMVADPFGNILVDETGEGDPRLFENGTIRAILRRGHLVCGLVGNRAGFAHINETTGELQGLEVDYCRGISASLFAGEADRVRFVPFSGLQDLLPSLALEQLDVAAGVGLSMTTDVREPSTGVGFTFAPPYFYGPDHALAMATRQDDAQFADLVRWVTFATIYAEEQGITEDTAADMPVVEVFGSEYRQMFRDTIHAVGNYGSMYDRNLEGLIPRSGRNLLNRDGGPQIYPLQFS